MINKKIDPANEISRRSSPLRKILILTNARTSYDKVSHIMIILGDIAFPEETWGWGRESLSTHRLRRLLALKIPFPRKMKQLGA